MPLLCPALSRECGWSCCQWEGEGKRQEHARGAHEALAPALRGDRDVGLGVGTSLSCGQTITLGQAAPVQLWGFQELLYCKESVENIKLRVPEGERSAGCIPASALCVKCALAAAPGWRW